MWGTNVANNQPVFTKYLYLARKRGARVVVVNPYLEPGLERYWVPSNVESALFGTKLCDLHVAVRPEGDVALANAVLHGLIERDAIDRDWIGAHTEGWDELEAFVRGLDRAELLARAGVDGPTFERFVDLYAARGRRCSCGAWASPSTPTVSTGSGRSSTSAWRGATWAATAPG